MVEMLLRHGANAEIGTDSGVLPRDRAAENGMIFDSLSIPIGNLLTIRPTKKKKHKKQKQKTIHLLT